MICDRCGCDVGNSGYCPNCDPQPVKEEKASVGLAILSFLIPIVGLVVFLVNRKDRPKTAKASGICALVSFILSIVMYVVIFVGLLGGSYWINNNNLVDGVNKDRIEYSDIDRGFIETEAMFGEIY